MEQRNTYNSWDEVEKQIAEGGGGTGDVTKEYVDQQDNALSARIGTNTTNIANLNTNKADRTDVQNKLDKLTDVGEYVYSHDGDVQTSKGFEVADEPSGSATHVASSKTVKAVKTALDTAKADKATSLSGYGITDAYTKTEVDNLVKVENVNNPGTITNGSGLSDGTNYDSNVTPRLIKIGKFACLTLHLKFASSAVGAGWTRVYTLSAGNRPVRSTPIVGMVYDNVNGNFAAGGSIDTSGIVQLWTNAKSAGNNYQVRLNVCFELA